MALTIVHASLTGAAANSNYLVDGPKWDANHTITGSVAASEITSGAALTKVDDTNVTLTLGGTPTAALLAATSVTVGWTGTLAAARLNSNVVQSVVNDTNVTGSIVTQALTLSWTGTLAAGRGGFGADVSASSGVPLFATGTPTFTGTSGTGDFARVTSPTFVTPALGTPSSGVATNLTGTASGLTAGNATNSGITDDTTTNATMYPAWVTANTGNLPLKVTSTKLTFNPSTGLLTTTALNVNGATTIATSSAAALTVGNTGATNSVFLVDASTASQAAGLKVTGAATGGTVAVAAIDSGLNTNLSINGKGSGTIAIGNVSTGAVTITPATTLSNALTYGGVTLSNAVTGTGNMVLSTSPSLTTPTLGVATATSVNKVTITAPATSATLTLTDGTTVTGPASSGTLATTTQVDAKADGAASSTDNAAARYDSTTGKVLQNSALIIADTTGSLSRSGNGGIPLQGTNTNDSAAAGNVGEFVSDSDDAVSLTTATGTNISSISLTAGDWDITAGIVFSGTASTQATELWASINTVSGTNVFTQGQNVRLRGTTYTDPLLGFPVGTLRVSLTATTTYYLNAQANFSVSTLTASGIIRARRVR